MLPEGGLLEQNGAASALIILSSNNWGGTLDATGAFFTLPGHDTCNGYGSKSAGTTNQRALRHNV